MSSFLNHISCSYSPSYSSSSLPTEENSGCNNEEAKSANKAPRNPTSSFFISSFMGTIESSNNFMIFVISFISSFEINKLNSFFALTAPFPLTFISNLFIPFEVKLFTNPSKLSLAKKIARSVSDFFA